MLIRKLRRRLLRSLFAGKSFCVHHWVQTVLFWSQRVKYRQKLLSNLWNSDISAIDYSLNYHLYNRGEWKFRSHKMSSIATESGKVSEFALRIACLHYRSHLHPRAGPGDYDGRLCVTSGISHVSLLKNLNDNKLRSHGRSHSEPKYGIVPEPHFVTVKWSMSEIGYKSKQNM